MKVLLSTCSFHLNGHTLWIIHGLKSYNHLACVAGVQRGGRGEVECEREARSLGTRGQRSRFVLLSRFALAFNFPLPPLCTPATKPNNHLVQHNKQYHMKVLLSSFHCNGHTLGFHLQTQLYSIINSTSCVMPLA